MRRGRLLSPLACFGPYPLTYRLQFHISKRATCFMPIAAHLWDERLASVM